MTKPIQAKTTGGTSTAAPPGSRQLALGAGLAVVACAVWWTAIRPMEQKLAAAKGEYQSTRAQLAEFEQMVSTEAPLPDAIAAMTAQAGTLNAWTSKSGDSTRLYDAFHTLAKHCGVRVERLEPSSSRGAATKRDPKAPETIGYTIEITGKFEAVSRYIDACEQELGVTKITSFHMSPAANSSPQNSSDPLLTAIIETTHLKLTVQSSDAPEPVAAKPAAPKPPARRGK